MPYRLKEKELQNQLDTQVFGFKKKSMKSNAQH
jgi:hypothetical protein